MTSFRVSKAGAANQTGFTVPGYNLVTWPTINRNAGGGFSGTSWTPVPSSEEDGRVVDFAGQLWVLKTTQTSGTPNYVARIVKNGNLNNSLGAKIGVPGVNFPNTFVIDLAMQDYAEPGDYYEVYMHATVATAEIDNNGLHSWWSGQ